MIIHDDAALARLNLSRLRADYRELRDSMITENGAAGAVLREQADRIVQLEVFVAKLQDALAEACDDETSRERFIELRALAATPIEAPEEASAGCNAKVPFDLFDAPHEMLGVLVEYKVAK